MESGAHLVNESRTEVTERIDEPVNVFEGLSRVSSFTHVNDHVRSAREDNVFSCDCLSAGGGGDALQT